MSKNIAKLMTFSPEMWKALTELQEEKGFISPAEANRYCIAVATSKPAYAKVEDRRATASKMTPLERANAEMEATEAKEEAKKAKQTALCDALGGTVDGNGWCNYFQDEIPNIPSMPADKIEVKTPLMNLVPADLAGQWRDNYGNPTDRKIVEAHIKKRGAN